MPSCSKAKNPRGVEIIFTEEDHSYRSVIDGHPFKYVSGTTFISGFFLPFDPCGTIAESCAKKRGITKEEIQAEWNEKAKQSCIYGTKIHETCEDVLKGSKAFRNKPNDSREKAAMDNAVTLCKRLLEKGTPEGIEKIVFDERLGIAGTIDLLFRAKKDGKLWILDHKSNASIDTENRYNSFAKAPISHVPDTNFWHYSLQLNLYEYLMKYAGYIPEDEKVGKALLHITENGVRTYPVSDMRKEIEAMVSFKKKMDEAVPEELFG